MTTIKLTPALCTEIRQHARNFIGGFGMWLELGERFNTESSSIHDTYFNCYTPGDREDGDLADHVPWNGVKGLEIPTVEVDGEERVLLDFYVHDSEELIDNLLVEITIDGLTGKASITKVWVTGCQDRDLRYTATVQR